MSEARENTYTYISIHSEEGCIRNDPMAEWVSHRRWGVRES